MALVTNIRYGFSQKEDNHPNFLMFFPDKGKLSKLCNVFFQKEDNHPNFVMFFQKKNSQNCVMFCFQNEDNHPNFVMCFF